MLALYFNLIYNAVFVYQENHYNLYLYFICIHLRDKEFPTNINELYYILDY